MADATLNPYGIVVQAAPDEILGATCPDDLNLLALSRHPSLLEDGVVIALPSLAGAAEARKKLMSWGFRAIVGEAYNVARRLLDASDCFEPQTYIVRVLCIWTNINLSLIDSMVSSIQDAPCDYLALPRDFDVTMAADIATREALERIASMKGQTAQASRARFNPFGYMETNPTSFNVREFASVPTYSQGEKAAILGRHRCHPENEFCGRDYSGSRYEFLLPYIPQESRVLDIACGAGHGAYLLSKHASFCLGSDYLESYIEQARSRFPENKRLRFVQGDAQSFLWEGGEYFDVVVSLHTLEHVPDDRAMICSLAANLKSGGVLILEVPLLSLRPVGTPMNPFHLREYSPDEALNLIKLAGLKVVRQFGCCRGFTVDSSLARDAIQIHAAKGEFYSK